MLKLLALAGVILFIILSLATAHGQETTNGSADAIFQQAMTFKAEERYDEALEAVKRALRYSPSQNHYLFQAGDICQRKKDYPQAVRYFRLLTEYFPEIPYNYAFAGINAYLGHEYATAKSYLQRALRWNREALTPQLYETTRAYLADINGGRTYRIVWELQPKPSLLEEGRIRIPLPTSDVPFQKLVTYTLTGAQSFVEKTESTGNKVLLVEPVGTQKLILTATVTCKLFRIRASSGTTVTSALPADVTPYLKPSFFANTDGRRVNLIAAQLKALDDTATVRNIVHWLDHTIHYQLLSFDSIDQILDRGTVACEGYSALFCALCRSCGIPAREVWEVAWPNPESGRLNGHGWSEVYLSGQGWCPIDATPPSRDDMAGPDHVRMGHYSTESEFRLWRNLIEMNIGPSTTASTPYYELIPSTNAMRQG